MLKTISSYLNKSAVSLLHRQTRLVQLGFVNRYSASTTESNKGRYYKLHEVQFININDTRDQCDQLITSQYYKDSTQQRNKFFESRLGLNRSGELKHKLNYILTLREKEMYQQKKINELIKIAVKYMEGMQRKYETIDSKKQQEFVYFLRNIHDMMIYMNILDSTLWRVYFESIVLISTNKGFTFHYATLMSSIDQFTKRFYNESCDLFRSKVVFKDADLVNILTPKLLLQLLSNLEQCPVESVEAKPYVLSLFYLASFIWKISKTSMVSGFHRLQFFAKQKPTVLRLLPDIKDVDLGLSLYYSLGISGAIDKDLNDCFSKFFIENKAEVCSKEPTLAKIIDLWTNMGSGSQELYDIIETTHMETILNKKDIAYIMKQLLLMPSTNIKVSPDNIRKIFQHLTNHSETFNNISYFQLEILYNLLVYYRSFMPEVINKEFYKSSVYQSLLEHMKMVDNKQSVDSLIDMKKEVQKLKEQVKNTKNGGLKYSKEDENQSSQLDSLQGLKQENLTTKSLVYWLNLQKLEDEFIVVSNKMVCLYELDILVYSKKLDKLTAIEVSGQNYKNIDGSFIGKRFMKNKIFEANELPIKYLDVTEDKLFHNHITLGATRKYSKQAIGETVLKLIEESFGQTYPRIEISTPKPFISKKQNESSENTTN